MAALAYGAHEYGVAPPSLQPVRGAEGERIAYLTPQQEARLLAAYSPWAAPVMVILCETGMRTSEALQLDWRHVDWQRGVLWWNMMDGATGHAPNRANHVALACGRSCTRPCWTSGSSKGSLMLGACS